MESSAVEPINRSAACKKVVGTVSETERTTDWLAMLMATLPTVSAPESGLKLALKYFWASSCRGAQGVGLPAGPLPVAALLLPSEEQELGLLPAAPTAKAAESSASAMLACSVMLRA